MIALPSLLSPAFHTDTYGTTLRIVLGIDPLWMTHPRTVDDTHWASSLGLCSFEQLSSCDSTVHLRFNDRLRLPPMIFILRVLYTGLLIWLRFFSNLSNLYLQVRFAPYPLLLQRPQSRFRSLRPSYQGKEVLTRILTTPGRIRVGLAFVNQDLGIGSIYNILDPHRIEVSNTRLTALSL